MINNFSLNSLFPQITSIGDSPLDPEQLSAIFVLALICIFVFFFALSLRALFSAKKNISWVASLLEDETTISLASNRATLLEKAKNTGGDVGHVWAEFDETLIEIKDESNIKLYNTIDSHHFFNSSTLANKITESRMLAAVPGFLTAIGVVGTFIGLQMGLSGLNISEGVAVSEMKSGLSIVISGAKIAFITSVWGVFLSVAFNFIEKLFENSARKSIHRLQVRIDGLFDRLSAEHQLQRIADDGQESRVSLQGLAEQIGEKMQESLVEATASIQAGLESSLEKIMAPAINKLVDETSDGNQKAMDSLIETFLERFGDEGAAQREAMDISSKKAGETFESMGNSLSAFLEKMEESHTNTAEREKELIESISNQVSHLVEQSTEQRKMLTEVVGNQINNLSDAFQERDKNSTARDEKRQDVFMEQTSSMKESTERLLDHIEERMEAHSESTKTLLEQGDVLQRSVTESIKANVDASASLMSSSKELREASQEIKVFGAHIRDTGNALSKSINDAVTSTSELSNQTQKSSELMVEYRQQLVNDKEQFSQITERLQSMLNTVDSSFDKMNIHQNKFLEDLKGNVSGLSEQMTSLLSDYSEQANAQTTQHLAVWAEHTTNYAEQMNNSARALSNVVDEIEDKLSA